MPDALTIAAADHAMRNWSHPRVGRVRIGSSEHCRMFSNMLLETHNLYKPAAIEWPALSSEALARVTSLPIWDIAVQTEGRASVRVEAFARTVKDSLLRAALDLDGAEEARHKVVLSKLVMAYGIALAPEPVYEAPRDVLWGWMVTGYSECIDSFFAFGLFEVARRSGYFPPALVDTFEPVIQEEARHILFFVNWVAWYKRGLPLWRRPSFFLKEIAVWVFLIWERLGIARGLDSTGSAQDANFTVHGSAAVGVELKAAEMIELCLTENERRMAGYDPRLLRPALVPRLARLARRWLR